MSQGLPGVFPHLLELPVGVFHEAEGALLFADISGFTSLAERLARQGKVGTEALTSLLNACFSSLLEVIAGYGGEVLGFGGDALLAGFYGPSQGAEVQALSCGAGLLQAMDPFRAVGTPAGEASLRIKSVVASGRWGETLLGDRRRTVLFLYGERVHALAHMENHARAGELWVQGVRVVPPPVPFSRQHRPGRDREMPLEEALRFLPQGVEQFLERALQGEHRMATTVFVSICGYDVVHPPLEALQEVMLEILDLLEARHGSLNKSDFSVCGWKLLLTFGAPQTTEESHLQALEVAHALRDRMPSGLEVRIGVATGSVYAGIVGGSWAREYTVIGDPVNVAARLAGAASPGEILMDRTTHALSLTRFPSRFCGAVRVQGKGEPLPCYTPGIGKSRGTSWQVPFVGRAKERAELRKALEQHGVVLLLGGAGMGKTRLLHAVVRELPGERQILRAVVEERGEAFEVFRDLIDSLAGVLARPDVPARREVLEAHVREIPDPRGVLERRIPFLGELLFHLPYPSSICASVGARLRQENLLEALRGYLEGLRARGPLLVLVDNAQWLQPTALEFFQHLVDHLIAVSPAPHPVTFVFAGRESPNTLSHLFLPERFTHRIFLDPLTGPETRALAEAVLDRPLNDREAEVLVRLTRGYPLQVEQMMLHVRSEGLSLEELLEETGSLSGGLWQGVMARVDRLSPDAQAALRVGSVIGQTFPAGVVSRVLGRSALESLVDAERAGIVERKLGAEIVYGFRHPAVRDAIYHSILETDLRALHLRVAEAWEAIAPEKGGETAEVLAHHFLQAGCPSRACPYLTAWAHRCREQGQFREAIRHFERALQILETDVGDREEERFRLHLACAKAWETLGEIKEAMRHFASAEELAGDRPCWLARLYREMAHTLAAQGQVIRAREMALRSRDQLDRCRSPAAFLRAEVQGTLCWVHHMAGDYARAVAEGEASLVALEEDRSHLGAEQERDWMLRRAMLLNFLGLAWMGLEENDRAREHFEEALMLADIGRNPELLASIEGNYAILEERCGNAQKALERVQRQLDYARRIGAFRDVARVANNLGLMILRRQGDGAKAEALFREALAIGRDRRLPLVEAQTRACLGLLCAARGEFSEALKQFERARRAFEDLGLPQYARLCDFHAVLLLADRGDCREALVRVRALIEGAGSRGDLVPAVEMRIAEAGILIRMGRLEEAAALLEGVETELEGTSEAWFLSLLRFWQGCWLARQGDLKRARKRLREALARGEDVLEVSWIARILLELGEISLRLGDPGGCRHLHRAEQIFRTLGHRSGLERVAALQRDFASLDG